MKKLNKVLHATDTDGAEIVLVPLANLTVKAKVLKEDYERLIALGLSNRWNLNSNNNGLHYVRVSPVNLKGGQTLTELLVSRLVAQAGSKQIVRYQDGNRLNLRSDNLITSKGTAKHGFKSICANLNAPHEELPAFIIKQMAVRKSGGAVGLM